MHLLVGRVQSSQPRARVCVYLANRKETKMKTHIRKEKQFFVVTGMMTLTVKPIAIT